MSHLMGQNDNIPTTFTYLMSFDSEQLWCKIIDSEKNYLESNILSEGLVSGFGGSGSSIFDQNVYLEQYKNFDISRIHRFLLICKTVLLLGVL